MAAAASLALRRSTSSSLLSNLLHTLRPTRVAPAASRSFNSKAQMSRFDDDSQSDDDERPLTRGAPLSFSDVLGLSLNPMDRLFIANPFSTTGSRRHWDVKEDNNGLYIRMDFPGLGKENVKVSVEQNTLVVKGAGDKEDDEVEPRRISNRIVDLPEKVFKLDGIKAEMKNGVLKVMVPKLKTEERTDVRHVQIQ